MNKNLIVLLVLLCSIGVSAQVKIGGADGEPSASSMLEVESNNKGVLIPRIALTAIDQKLDSNIENANSLLIYNTATVAAQGIVPGYYYWKEDTTTPANSVWVRMISEGDQSLGGVKFFYMPSIVINTETNGTGFKRNLHAEYISQFTNKEFIPNSSTGGSVGSAVRPTFVKSTGAPVSIPNTPSATNLWYYVTDYDNTSLTNLSIDENGILTYDVIGTGTDYSFVNIVFVVK